MVASFIAAQSIGDMWNLALAQAEKGPDTTNDPDTWTAMGVAPDSIGRTVITLTAGTRTYAYICPGINRQAPLDSLLREGRNVGIWRATPAGQTGVLLGLVCGLRASLLNLLNISLPNVTTTSVALNGPTTVLYDETGTVVQNIAFQVQSQVSIIGTGRGIRLGAVAPYQYGTRFIVDAFHMVCARDTATATYIDPWTGADVVSPNFTPAMLNQPGTVNAGQLFGGIQAIAASLDVLSKMDILVSTNNGQHQINIAAKNWV